MDGKESARHSSIRRVTHRLAGKTYWSWKLYQSARARWKCRWLRSENPVLVYQMGKVASRSVEHALRASSLESEVVHVHFLAPATVRSEERHARKRFRESMEERGTPGPQWPLQVNAQARMIVGHIDRMRKRAPIKIVTLVRDPVAQQLSDFFHNLDRRAPRLAECLVEGPASSSTIELLERAFFDVLSDHEPFEWFDDELREVFDVDVFHHDFDSSVGYSIIRAGDVEVLVMRYEDLRHAFEPAVASFLGVSDADLPRDNTVEGKYYADVYAQARRTLRLAPDELNRIYASPRVRHFYSDSELTGLRDRWAA